MKHLLFILTMSTLYLFGCSRTRQSSVNNLGNDSIIISHTIFPDDSEMFDNERRVCFVKYHNQINGYDVRITVRNFEYNDSKLIGNAEIAFLRHDTCFISLPNPFFRICGLNNKNIGNYDIVELVYKKTQINKSKPIGFNEFSSLPFFFLDVNFDEQDELIMNYARQGQRYSNAYVAYGLQYWKGNIGYDFLYDSTRGIAPFSDLDDLSEIDYTKKEISTFCYAGYSDSEKRIYKPINGKISLHMIENYDSLGWLLARRQILCADTITTYHNGREYLYKK